MLLVCRMIGSDDHRAHTLSVPILLGPRSRAGHDYRAKGGVRCSMMRDARRIPAAIGRKLPGAASRARRTRAEGPDKDKAAARGCPGAARRISRTRAVAHPGIQGPKTGNARKRNINPKRAGRLRVAGPPTPSHHSRRHEPIKKLPWMSIHGSFEAWDATSDATSCPRSRTPSSSKSCRPWLPQYPGC